MSANYTLIARAFGALDNTTYALRSLALEHGEYAHDPEQSFCTRAGLRV
jgi:hypothetical protein